MANRSGFGLRLTCLVITLISLLLSVFLGFSIYSEKKAAGKYEKAIIYANERSAENETKAKNTLSQAEALQEQKELIQEDIRVAEKKKVYETQATAFLTFDDSPSANTLKILEILKQQGVTATFFVVGSRITENNLPILQRIIDNGHTVAMSANKIDYATIYSSSDAYLSDLNALRDKLLETVGISPNIVRMPGGTYSAYSYFKKYGGSETVFDSVVEELEYQGLALCDWNVDTKDYGSTPVRTVIDNALDGAKTRASGQYKRKTAILLMHNNNSTVEALPDIIKGLKDMGFVFEALDAEANVYRQK